MTLNLFNKRFLVNFIYKHSNNVKYGGRSLFCLKCGKENSEPHRRCLALGRIQNGEPLDVEMALLNESKDVG